jgi:hypothetical protein
MLPHLPHHGSGVATEHLRPQQDEAAKVQPLDHARPRQQHQHRTQFLVGELFELAGLELLLLFELLEQGRVVRARLLDLRLLNGPAHVQHPRPVAPDIERLQFGGRFVLRRVFELE